MPLHARLSAALAGAALLAMPAAAHAALGTNVVRDGGGEGITASPTEDDQRVPPDWTGTGRFSVRPYGAPGGFPSGAHGNTIGGGANFFEGGNAAESTGVQTVSLAADAAAISSGAVRADLGAHLGGYLTDDDAATVTVSWLDGSGNPTGAPLVVGPVTAADRGNATELQRRTASASVPSNAREARVVLTITRAAGANNDGYADNVSLVLTDTRPPPPPGGFDPGAIPGIRPINLTPPQVGGEYRAGADVGCLPGMWLLSPTFSYAWSINGTPVPGATQPGLRLPRNARGKKVACTVTARAEGATATATSEAVDVGARARCPLVGRKRKCLRRGQRCKPRFRDDYLRAGFRCRRRGKKRVLARATPRQLRGTAFVRYGANGLPSFRDAKMAFDKQIGDLPGVRQKRGVVGKSFEGTAALTWMQHYRDRLTPRQRAVLDEFTRPTGARKAGSSPAMVKLRNLVPEVRRRLALHGITIKRGITVKAGPVGKAFNRGEAAATSYSAWLYGDGPNCVITIGPLGEKVADDLPDARELMAHEVFHCAQGELAIDGPQFNARPNWTTEGGATWAGGRIALEWGGILPDFVVAMYREWLDNSQPDLFKRDYDAVGWYQLLEHEGANPWAALMDTQRMGMLYGPNAAMFAGLSATTDGIGAWGPTLATEPANGDYWDLRIPGMRSRGPRNGQIIKNGTNWYKGTTGRGGYAIELPLRADVVEVYIAGGPLGRWKPPDEDDRPLRPGTYCVKPGGCECPDGGDHGLEEIKRGTAHLGFFGFGPAAVGVSGESLDHWCKTPRDTGINIYRLTNGLGPEPLVGTIKAGNCRRARDGFTARAKSTNGDWNLLIRIAGFEGFGRDYLLAYGEGDPWFRLDGPSGPYSNVFPVPGRPNGGAIAFNDKGTGFGFGFVPTFNRDRSAGVAIAGGMKCRYRGRRG